MAITTVLDYQEYKDARMYLGIATKFDAIIELGGLRDFIEAMQYNRETLVEEGTDPELRFYYESISQICTNQGLVEYLSSVCPCLDDVKARHAKICDTCLDEHKKILRCSRCHKAKYCTPTCQKRDWKYHKRYCNKFVNAQQQLEKMKEES